MWPYSEVLNMISWNFVFGAAIGTIFAVVFMRLFVVMKQMDNLKKELKDYMSKKDSCH